MYIINNNDNISDNIAKYGGIGRGLYLLISVFNDKKNIKNRILYIYSFLLALPLKANKLPKSKLVILEINKLLI